jgi:tetratricopeptide (TPR) repeat protein
MKRIGAILIVLAKHLVIGVLFGVSTLAWRVQARRLAVGILRRIAAMAPNRRADVLLHLASLHVKSNEQEAAVAAYQDARRLKPNDPMTAIEVAEGYECLGRYSDAATLYREALRDGDDLSEAFKADVDRRAERRESSVPDPKGS